MIVLGIDPGSAKLGYAFLKKNNDQVECLDAGTLVFPKVALSKKLFLLYKKLDQLMSQYPLEALAIESIFTHKNVQSSFVLGHIRGVCMMMGEKFNAPAYEYAPKKIKKLVTGSGNAPKAQVAMSLSSLLCMPEVEQAQYSDTTDAIAVAWTHLMSQRSFEASLQEL